MNENIDLTKILKDCPKGTKLYSPIFGDVIYEGIDDKDEYPIKAKYKSEKVDDWYDYIRFTKEGLFLNIIKFWRFCCTYKMHSAVIVGNTIYIR